jgi:DNA-binding response OmpR family regulator
VTESDIMKGLHVLVVEDDFYIADDLTMSMEDAGALVLGPCNTVAVALHLLERTNPDCAVVDVNLGSGPNFEIAGALTARSIPFVLATGYDVNIVPAEFAAMPCLQKPVSGSKVVATVAELCRTRRTVE